LNMSSPGIQLWTVPKSGNYDIELAGASSVLQHYNSPSPSYGLGAKFTTRYALTYNTVIKILCGQLPANNGGYVTAYNGGTQSASPGCFNGGGGGTYVTASDNTPIAIAGGGGSNRVGYAYNQTYMDARMDFNTSGNPGGKSPSGEGTNGGGATNWNSSDGSGGAGLTGDAFGPAGGAGAGSEPAKAFINGGRGAILGSSPNNPTAHGGFGGGGHGGWGGSGGAGGYSGGGTGTNDGAAGYGGGGANFNAGTIQVSPVTYSGAGYVKITKV
jgi:tripartite motif-containing protein 56